MRLTNYLAMSLFAVLAMAAQAIFAEPVPDRASGVWSVTDCGTDSITFLTNSGSAIVMFPPEDGEEA